MKKFEISLTSLNYIKEMEGDCALSIFFFADTYLGPIKIRYGG